MPQGEANYCTYVQNLSRIYAPPRLQFTLVSLRISNSLVLDVYLKQKHQ